MKHLILSLSLALLAPLAASANSFGVFGGLNSNEFKSSGNSWDREFGFEFGMSAIIPLQGQLFFRTGAGFLQKNSTLKAGGNAYDFNMTYLQIPATLMYDLTPQVGLYSGLNIDLKINDECETSGGSCTVGGAKTIVMNLPIGARYNLAGSHYIEGDLELGLTDLARSTKLSNALAARYVYMFR